MGRGAGQPVESDQEHHARPWDPTNIASPRGRRQVAPESATWQDDVNGNLDSDPRRLQAEAGAGAQEDPLPAMCTRPVSVWHWVVCIGEAGLWARPCVVGRCEACSHWMCLACKPGDSEQTDGPPRGGWVPPNQATASNAEMDISKRRGPPAASSLQSLDSGLWHQVDPRVSSSLQLAAAFTRCHMNALSQGNPMGFRGENKL